MLQVIYGMGGGSKRRRITIVWQWRCWWWHKIDFRRRPMIRHAISLIIVILGEGTSEWQNIHWNYRLEMLDQLNIDSELELFQVCFNRIFHASWRRRWRKRKGGRCTQEEFGKIDSHCELCKKYLMMVSFLSMPLAGKRREAEERDTFNTELLKFPHPRKNYQLSSVLPFEERTILLSYHLTQIES